MHVDEYQKTLHDQPPLTPPEREGLWIFNALFHFLAEDDGGMFPCSFCFWLWPIIAVKQRTAHCTTSLEPIGILVTLTLKSVQQNLMDSAPRALCVCAGCKRRHV